MGDEKANILLVDDQRSRLLSYEAILSTLGENLVTAQSGTEALQRLLEQDFAAILLDVNMPGMDGFETAAMIHQHPRFDKTPIIFVTAVHASDLDRLRGYELGAVDYVYVPIVPQILRSKVQVLVELFAQRRKLQHLNASLARANVELADANEALRTERARELNQLNRTLERTNTDLAAVNASLEYEIVERKRAQQDLQAANRRKDEFLAVLSHELRNPLSAVAGAVQIMAMKELEDPHLRWVRDVLTRQTTHLTRMLDDLLDVSRITRGQITLRNELVDLASIINGAIETTHGLIDTQRHELEVRMDDQPLVVMGDVVRLTQIVNNLLTNAAKYMEPAGLIVLSVDSEASTGKQDREAVIRVKDKGQGIPPAMLQEVFQLFRRLDNSPDDRNGGLGIGLAVTRALVEMHGGSIEAFSEGVGHGCEFVVRLPIAVPEDSRAAATDSAVPPPARKARTLDILIADDNIDSAQMVAMALELEGHEVRVVHDGEQAVQAAREQTPDVIFMDIGMPTLNGYEVARQLRAEDRLAGTRLVAMTGYGHASDRERSRSAGFEDHLVKPLDYEQLRRVLAKLCDAESD